MATIREKIFTWLAVCCLILAGIFGTAFFYSHAGIDAMFRWLVLCGGITVLALVW